MSQNIKTEEAALEVEVQAQLDSGDLDYLRAFNEAREANWQRGGGKITECNAAAVAILRKYFILRSGA